MAGITFGNIVEKLVSLGKENTFSWLLESSPNEVNKVTLKKKFEKIINRYQNLRKSINSPIFQDKFDKFKQEQFVFPKTVPFKRRKSGTDLEVENITDFQCSRKVIAGLAKDLAQVKSENDTLREEKETLAAQVKTRLSTKSRLKKSLGQKKILKKQMKHANYLLIEKNKKLKQVRASRDYNSKKCEYYQNNNVELKNENEQLRTSVNQLAKEVEMLKKENDDLKEHKLFFKN